MTGPAEAPAPPAHAPVTCKSCGAPIFWAQLLGKDGKRVQRDDKKGWKAIPVDHQPSLEGNVQLFHRTEHGIVCKVYRRPADAPPGAKLRMPHFATCPNADHHRKKGRR